MIITFKVKRNEEFFPTVLQIYLKEDHLKCDSNRNIPLLYSSLDHIIQVKNGKQ